MSENTAAPRPRVGAVVLTWRDRVQTQLCVDDLLANASVRRVIVVDNEADGAIAETFRPDPRVEFRELAPNTGFTVGGNTGLRRLLNDPSNDLPLATTNHAPPPPPHL